MKKNEKKKKITCQLTRIQLLCRLLCTLAGNVNFRPKTNETPYHHYSINDYNDNDKTLSVRWERTTTRVPLTCDVTQ
jgi:hypothetical protein